MERSQIIKDLIRSEKSISVSLQELLVIVNELENKDLNIWIKNELNGYKNIEDIPDYRRKLPHVILYSGINGSFNVTNQPLPIQAFGNHIDEVELLNSINNSILELENLGDKVMQIDLTMFASCVQKNTGISCYNIALKFGTNISDIIISNVKTKLIESLLLLEKEFGLLDELCLNDSELNRKRIEKVNKNINSIIFVDGARY